MSTEYIKVVAGDIWTLQDMTPGSRVVIPTNIGWKSNGWNVMGRGLAQQAARREPELQRKYGLYCQINRENTDVWLTPNLILFPTKSLNKANPSMSWNAKSDITLIKRSIDQLVVAVDTHDLKDVLVPMVGCGNGGLAISQVAPLLLQLNPSRFTLVVSSEAERKRVEALRPV